MTTDPTALSAASAAATGSGTSVSSAASASLSADYEAFLQLLTAQVANQDPLEPMDSTTFVSQLAQLSQVEQAIQTNSNLETIASQLSSASSFADVALIGKTVSLSSSSFELGEGGGAELSYRLADNASSVSATILAADGTELRRIEGLPTSAGEAHGFTWDGNDYAGLPLPPGRYEVEIRATGADGKAVSYETFTQATVDSVVFEQGQSLLSLDNGETVAASSVRAVE
ncbi:flagellar hook assembly protein FlgD [Roseivivax sp.]